MANWIEAEEGFALLRSLSDEPLGRMPKGWVELGSEDRRRFVRVWQDRSSLLSVSARFSAPLDEPNSDPNKS